MLIDIIYMLKNEGINPKYAPIIKKIIDGIDFDFTKLEKYDKEETIKIPFLPKKMNYLNVTGISRSNPYILFGENKNSDTTATFNFLHCSSLIKVKEIFDNILNSNLIVGYEGLITCLEKKNSQKLYYFNYEPSSIYKDYNQVSGIRGYIIDKKSHNKGIYIINIVVVKGIVKTAIIDKYSIESLKQYQAFNKATMINDFEIKYTNKAFKQLNIFPIEHYDINIVGIQHYIEEILNALHLYGVDALVELGIDDPNNTILLQK